MSRKEKPTQRTANATIDRDGKRLKKVKADHHRPKYKHLLYSED